jgi:ribosomal protein L11 methylase PrmA
MESFTVDGKEMTAEEFVKSLFEFSSVVLRGLLSKDEARVAERLAKSGFLHKGKSEERGRNRIVYYRP